MPNLRAGACAVPTCPHRKPCPVHRRTQNPARMRGRRLQAFRRCVLSAQPICAECAKTLPLHLQRPSVQLDHILPLSQGGTDDLTNLRGICREHHAVKTARERWRRR